MNVESVEKRPVNRGIGRMVLLGVAEADPADPDNPDRFKYGGSRDPDLAYSISRDDIARVNIEMNYQVRINRTSLIALLSLIEAPEGRKKSAVDNAQASFAEMRAANPRFSHLSDQELLLLIQSRVDSFNSQTNTNSMASRVIAERRRNASPSRESKSPPPPPIDVVKYYRDEPTSLLDGILERRLPPIGTRQGTVYVSERVIQAETTVVGVPTDIYSAEESLELEQS